jgi:hypothetical protein
MVGPTISQYRGSNMNIANMVSGFLWVAGGRLGGDHSIAWAAGFSAPPSGRWARVYLRTVPQDSSFRTG